MTENTNEKHNLSFAKQSILMKELFFPQQQGNLIATHYINHEHLASNKKAGEVRMA